MSRGASTTSAAGRWLAELSAVARTERARNLLTLAAILALLAFYKLIFTSHVFSTSIDGGYYSDVASHVRDGHGLVTSVSLLHKGYPTMPHPTAIYPLWPLVYGFVAKWFPLLATGKWLATTGYFAALVFGYLWAQALFPKPIYSGFGAGHVWVILLGTNREFFRYTTLPYTEGLGYAIAMLALWRCTKLWPKPSWRGGLEMGLWFGLATLARTQMLLLMLAAVPVLLGAVVLGQGERRRRALMAGCCVAGFAAMLMPHYLYLRTFIEDVTLTHLFRFDEVRFTPELSKLDVIAKTEGLWDYVTDRAKGFEVAFDPVGKKGYVPHFYAFTYALPAAAALLCFGALRRWRLDDLRRGWQWLRDPAQTNLVFVIVFAIGGFLSIHTMHKAVGGEWVFHRRHALTCAFSFFLALVYLLSRARRPGKAIGTLLLCAGVWLGWGSLRGLADKVADAKPRPYQPALVAWLHQQRGPGTLTVMMRQPQPLAPHTEGIHYHWYNNQTTYRDVEIMVTKLGAEYVIVPAKGSYRFMRSPAWRKHFTMTKTRTGFRIFRPDRGLLERYRRGARLAR